MSQLWQKPVNTDVLYPVYLVATNPIISYSTHAIIIQLSGQCSDLFFK